MPVDLVVASNRGPLTIETGPDGEDVYRRGGGGLVSGIQVALTASPGAIWVCAAMKDRERSIAHRADGGRLSSVPAADEALRGDFDVMMLPIDGLTFRHAYNGIANSTLWFVLHMLFEQPYRPVFDARWRRQWAAYERYNRAFADAIAEVAAPGATVMVQDYHLFLVPALLRQRRADLRIGLFTHTPWVTPDYFRMLPSDVARSILEGMTAADVVGFHTHRWAEDFRACCQAILGSEPTCDVHVFGLTTDGDQITERAHRHDVESSVRDLRETIGDRRVIGRVDRAELSKNVLRGLLAYRELLIRWPEWREQVVHVVFDNPSRGDLQEYRTYTRDIEDLAEQINDELGTDDWSPVLLTIEQDYPAALAALRLTDVVFVNPTRDGMNLVVFEAIVLAENDPVVVVSENAGAAELLGDHALIVNPFDISQTAELLNRALTMDADERAANARELRRAATSLPPAAWFEAQLDALPKIGDSPSIQTN